MSIVRNQISTISTIRNFAGISIQTRNHTERKPNLRRPKEPDFKKKLLLTLLEPFYERDRRLDSEKCIEWRGNRTYVPHPYVRMLSDDCIKELNSKFVYLFHLNSITDYYFNELRKDFLHKDIYLRNYSREVIELSIKNSRLSNLWPFFKHYGCFACSPELKLDEIIKLCKENDKITLMGGIIENRILNLKQLKDYKLLGNIDQVRAQLCSTLSTHSIKLSSTLNYHTKELSFNLTNYVEKDKEKSKHSNENSHNDVISNPNKEEGPS